MAEVNFKPELRFPEFEDNWRKGKLGDIAKIERGRFSPRPRNNPIYYGGEIPFVQTGDVVNSNGTITNYTQTLNEKGLEVSKLFKAGTILITIAANIGFTGVLAIDMACPDSLIGISCSAKCHNLFLNYLLTLEQPRMDRLAPAAAQKNINIEFLKPYKLNLPSFPEQQKIASFLTAIDERIQLLQKKKAKLEEYKKGVMQQLFSQQIRFKDEYGNDFPDWEEKKLGEIGATFNGLTGKTKVDFGEGKPYVQYMQIFSNSKINVEEFGFVKIEENENQSKVQYGDIFFTTSSETPNEIGTASVMLEEVEDVYLNSFCFGFRPNSLTELVPQFSRYLFRSELFRREIIKLAQGSTRFNMSKVELMKLRVLLPEEDEQIKIADFLTSLDDSIESIGVEIDGSIKYKKGLLQKMFV